MDLSSEPIRFTARTNSMIMPPADKDIIGAVCRYTSPSFNIVPSSGEGGWIPSPRNPSPEIAIILDPNPSVATSMIGP